MEESAGAEDGEGGGAIERVEEDAGAAGAAGTDVGAEVELVEGGSGGDAKGVGAEGAGADLVHPEGDDAEPGGAVVEVGLELRGEQRGELRGGDGPVGEEEIAPALAETPGAGGMRVGAVLVVEEIFVVKGFGSVVHLLE